MTGLSLRLWHHRGKAPVEGGGARIERLRAPVRSVSIPLLSRSRLAHSKFGEFESRPSVHHPACRRCKPSESPGVSVRILIRHTLWSEVLLEVAANRLSPVRPNPRSTSSTI